MFKLATYIVTKHVNVKISGHEICVHDVDFPKNPFHGSRDSTLIFTKPTFDRKKLTSFVVNQCGAPHVNLNLELWTNAEFSGFNLSLASKTNRTHSTPSNSVFLHNCSEAACFQPTPTPFVLPQYISRTFHYQPFFLNMALPFPFPNNAGTDILDDLNKQINKSENFLYLTSEISGT